ncbi:helix-turn-helix domain-containing protein [Alteromonas gilva]|uniref:Helix-turn-helix transcriptional regulator n=1 Tax=Alteromonas gilva TaxID=2987522 RepID=A0ABT5L772_9ALTE|nr:helix-turn-helix transcriptional regulator [Alteromonas gilva]MDC8832890.1 helix-turn-helix transcriptional regulator [Alteromonas gilva]
MNIEVLKNQRIKNNWTQQHLAKICGLSLRTIQRVEKTGITSAETVGALCAVFKINQKEIVVQATNTSMCSKVYHEYKAALYILLISQFVGIFGVFYSINSLSEIQFQIAIASVCIFCFLSFFTLAVSAHKKGMLKEL